MSKEAPQPDDLPGILADAGVIDPKYASAEWQEHCARTFRPLEPGAGATVDVEASDGDAPDDLLKDLEEAQSAYAEALARPHRVKPFSEWLRTKPRHARDGDYFGFLAANRVFLDELVAKFGLELLAIKPSLAEQCERPN